MITPIVILWRIFSGPRRSNFPKSFEFGMIESPEPFACIITKRMTTTARSDSMYVIKWYVKSGIYYEILHFLQIFGFFHNMWYNSSIIYCCMLRLIFFCTFLFSFLSSLFAEGSMTGIDYNIPVDQLSPLIGKKGDDQIGLVNNLNAVL
jgi:hypothetical protein